MLERLPSTASALRKASTSGSGSTPSSFSRRRSSSTYTAATTTTAQHSTHSRTRVHVPTNSQCLCTLRPQLHSTNKPLACSQANNQQDTVHKAHSRNSPAARRSHTGPLTLLVADAKAARSKVKGLPDCQLCLVLVGLADVGRGAGHFKGVKALSVVGYLTTQLRTQADSRWVCVASVSALLLEQQTSCTILTHAVSADSRFQGRQGLPSTAPQHIEEGSPVTTVVCLPSPAGPRCCSYPSADLPRPSAALSSCTVGRQWQRHRCATAVGSSRQACRNGAGGAPHIKLDGTAMGGRLAKAFVRSAPQACSRV